MPSYQPDPPGYEAGQYSKRNFSPEWERVPADRMFQLPAEDHHQEAASNSFTSSAQLSYSTESAPRNRILDGNRSTSSNLDKASTRARAGDTPNNRNARSRAQADSSASSPSDQVSASDSNSFSAEANPSPTQADGEISDNSSAYSARANTAIIDLPFRLPSDGNRELSIRGGSPDFVNTFCDIALKNKTGVLTVGYTRMLQNRVFQEMLSEEGKISVKRYHPLFVHNVFQLPSSMAAILSGEPAVLLDRMTPAILPGFLVRQVPDSFQPVLLYTGRAQDVAHGALIFGQGRKQQTALAQHFEQSLSKPYKLWAVYESLVKPAKDLAGSKKYMSLVRQAAKVTAFIWTGEKEIADTMVPWTIEEATQAKFSPYYQEQERTARTKYQSSISPFHRSA